MPRTRFGLVTSAFSMRRCYLLSYLGSRIQGSPARLRTWNLLINSQALCRLSYRERTRAGAPGETRTRSILVRSQALYPLSYWGERAGEGT